MNRLSARIPPLLLAGVLALLNVGLGLGLPAANLPSVPGHRGLAVVLALGGLALLFGAAGQFRSARTTVNPMTPDKASVVVAHGLYRLSRNPMYLGMALVLLGPAAWFVSVPGAGVAALFCAYIQVAQILPEERALQARFGADYEAYRRQVRRWI
jgi:protein-S-isoprenylcysteine O-methyltransferase Ste14